MSNSLQEQSLNARVRCRKDRGRSNLREQVHQVQDRPRIELLHGFDAKSDSGGVTSDFPGRARRRPWLLGHQFVQKAPAAHNLYLRVGSGDIVILKLRRPPAPVPLTRQLSGKARNQQRQCGAFAAVLSRA
jgi:hypothetical protein